MCVEEGRLRVDVIQSTLSIENQNKTLQHDFFYIITSKVCESWQTIHNLSVKQG